MNSSIKITAAAILFVAYSCKKDHSILGVDVQPASDSLSADYLSDLPVTAHSVGYDSVATFNDNYKFIGSNNDPNFGRTDIGLYLNANMSVTDKDFGDDSQISSAEIVLKVQPFEFAGDQASVLTYSVFAATNTLSPSTIYYTNNTRNHDVNAVPISVHTTSLTILPNGKFVISIKLDQVYAQALLRDKANLTSNEVFQAKYKGYYIAASLQSGSEGAIYKADLDDDESGLYLHYKPTSTADTIIDFKFKFSGTAASRYNTVKFSPSLALNEQFQDSSKGTNILFIKGMGMAKMKIRIPFLQNHLDSFKVAVNRAELILNVDPASIPASGYYPAPPELTLLSVDPLSRETFLQDLVTPTDYARYDGKFDATNKRYTFNLAREAQLIFEGKKQNNGFYLVVANTNISLKTIYAGASKELLPLRRDNYFESVVFAGNNNSQLKPKFNLNYIRFKND